MGHNQNSGLQAAFVLFDRSFMMPIAILSALADEQDGLVHLLQDMKQIAHAGRTFWRGKLHGTEVVCVLSGIGKVAAATTAVALIERFGAQAMVFTGVAGGLGSDVHVGDVVVARDYVQHDMDASPLFPRYEVPGYGRQRFACDPALTGKLAQAVQHCVRHQAAEWTATLGLPAPHMHEGLIVSGDRFVSGADESHQLRQGLEQAGLQPLAVEMEGAAIAQVCADYSLPFAAMRSISDRADDCAHVDFPKFVQSIASHYAQAVIEDLCKRIAA